MPRILLACVLVFTMLMPRLAQAQQPVPGDVCATPELFMQSTGPELAGAGHWLVCQGGTWKRVFSFDSTAQITGIGNQTCANNEILKFDGTKWACAADAGLAAETDPQVGTLTEGKWCYVNGGVVDCTQDPPGGGSPAHGAQLFTADGTFVVPADVTAVKATLVGGGGGGGGGRSFGRCGGGGGAGALVVHWLAVTPGANMPVVVGQGGSGGIGGGSPSDGIAGTASTIGSAIATGGAGGIKGGASSGGAGGAGGIASGGSINLSGGDGTAGGSGSSCVGGSGGSAVHIYHGNVPPLYGDGNNGGDAGPAGSAGADGMVQLEW